MLPSAEESQPVDPLFYHFSAVPYRFFIVRGWGIKGILIVMTVSPLFGRQGSLFLGVLKSGEMEAMKGEGVSGENYFSSISRRLFGYFEKVSNYLFNIPFITLLLALYLGKEEIALFSLAGEFSLRFLSLSLTPTTDGFSPSFQPLCLKIENQANATFSNTIKIVTFLSIPLGTFLYVFIIPYILYLDSKNFYRLSPLQKY